MTREVHVKSCADAATRAFSMGVVAAAVLRAAKGEPYFGSKRRGRVSVLTIQANCVLGLYGGQRLGWGGGGSLGMHGGVCVCVGVL